jgi:hypothetical protein
MDMEKIEDQGVASYLIRLSASKVSDFIQELQEYATVLEWKT